MRSGVCVLLLAWVTTTSLSLPGADAAALVISEFLAVNDGDITDADGDHSDWIELENRAAAAVDLEGWSLSDKTKDLDQWSFPAGLRLEPGAFLVVFASGKDRRDSGLELHTNFRLSGDGELLVLVRPDGETVEHGYIPVYPEQVSDVSYGLDQDGSERYFLESTPGEAPVGPGMTGLVAEPVWTVERGFFDLPFELRITNETVGAEIRYTLDGRRPTADTGLIYQEPLQINATTVVRAMAWKAGYLESKATTQTYLFLADVVEQPLMRLASVETHRATIESSLRSLPTLSIALAKEDFVNLQQQAATEDTKEELPASLEWIDPELGGRLQLTCAIEGHSWPASRFPKRAFRLKFKREFGPAKLEFPVFGDTPWNPGTAVDSFDRLILRRESWDSDESVARDEWTRASQVAMSDIGSHGTYAHVYFNGNYWGPYDICERPDASFGAAYGGDKEDDWFSTNHGIERGDTHLRGDSTRFDRLVQLAVQKDLEDPVKYAEFAGLVDLERFSDYVMLYWYAGVSDGIDNNWYALQRTRPEGPLTFFMWDTSACFREGLGGVGPPGNNGAWVPPFFFEGTGTYAVTTIVRTWQALAQNPDFRLLFADRIYKQCFHGGPLSEDQSRERWRAITDFIEEAMIGEEARWGKGEFLRDRDWRRSVEAVDLRMSDNVSRFTTALEERDLYVHPPELSQHGGAILPGAALEVSGFRLPVYYTLDGTDPRLTGGEVHPAATELGVSASGLIATDQALRFLVPQDDSLGLEWTAPEFDDAGWIDGQLGIGYSRVGGLSEHVDSNIEELMRGVNASVYLRVPFLVDDSVPPRLLLDVRYNDGFVAYLNGEQVLTRNAPDAPGWDSLATEKQDGRILERIDVSVWRDGLRNGENVLAVHGLNQRVTSLDFLFKAELRALDVGRLTLSSDASLRMRSFSDGVWSAMNVAEFFIEGPAALRVTELLYHPKRPDLAGSFEEGAFEDEDFEFIELENVSEDRVLDLSAYSITNGVRFDFSGSSVGRLDPGGIVLVVRNLEAFEASHDTGGMLIAGEYSLALDNAGDRIRLEGPPGTPVHEFRYDDAWYPSTDGPGHSLEAVDPAGTLEAWGRPDGWRPSDAPGGTPGRRSSGDVSGLQRKGDLTQDARLNIADVLELLHRLFSTTERALPCGDAFDGPGNRWLTDVNGDDAANVADASYLLRYLFQRGPQPVGGGCIPFAGCPDVCES